MVTISFIGDISLNDDYNRLFRDGIHPFDDLSEDLEDSDLVAGNLECLAAGTQGENLKKKPRLKTDLRTLEYLKQMNMGLACLAHNHVYDNLEDGFLKTTSFLEQNDIRHLGASLDNNAGNPMLQMEIKGIRFAFFNYVDEDTNLSLPPEAGIKLSVLHKDKVLEDLYRAREADFRILMLHWGGRYENSYYPGPAQIKLSKEFIRGGADLIIGHHPHTLQPSLRHKCKSVFFSLGNFCFADVRSDGRIKEIKYRRWKESAVLKVDFTKEGYQARLLPFRLENLHTVRDHRIISRIRFRSVYMKLIRFSRLFWFIYYFGFKYLRPVVWELRKKDPERNLVQRVAGLNGNKIKGMFK